MEPALAERSEDDAFLTAAELFIIFGTCFAFFHSGINCKDKYFALAESIQLI